MPDILKLVGKLTISDAAVWGGRLYASYALMQFLFSPIIIFFIDKKWIKGWFKCLVLIMILTPLHWRFFD